jgi:hypothetical protein
MDRASEGRRMDGGSRATAGGPGSRRFLAGDPLRGLAALGVGVYHAGTVSLFVSGHSGGLAGGWPAPFGRFAGGPIGAAAHGVDILFVLSGYLVSRPFLAAYAAGRRLPRVDRYLRNRVRTAAVGEGPPVAGRLPRAGRGRLPVRGLPARHPA